MWNSRMKRSTLTLFGYLQFSPAKRCQLNVADTKVWRAFRILLSSTITKTPQIVNAGNRLSYLSIYCVASSNVYTYNSNVYLTNSKNIMNKSYANTCDFSRGLTSSSSDELPVYDARYTYKTNEHNTCIWMLKTDSIICGLLVVANWINMLKSEIHTSVGLHITET